MCIFKSRLGFPGGTVIKNPPAKAGVEGDAIWKDPLEEEMATHSRILACKIPSTEEIVNMHYKMTEFFIGTMKKNKPR